MTNKVKPFYIRITDDMTPQMVQDAFDKCVDAGAIADESCEGANSKHRYKKSYDMSLYTYFGSDDYGMTYMDIDLQYFGGAQEITLDQLDEWLGLEAEQEWKNGDECIYKGNDAVVIGAHPSENTIIIDSCISGLEACDAEELSKTETPEQKAERERIENGKAIYDLMSSIEMNHDIAGTPNTWAELRDEWQSVYIQLAESVGYRKQ